MNCKQGDLAVMVKSYAGNQGKIVQCIRLATKEEIDDAWFLTKDGPIWIIDRLIPTIKKGLQRLAIDAQLRPIRPSEGQDETLTWAPVPKKERA